MHVSVHWLIKKKNIFKIPDHRRLKEKEAHLKIDQHCPQFTLL